MITTVIFDMDGVIIDSEPIHFAIGEEIFAALGIAVSEKEHQGYVGTSSQNMWEQIVKKYSLPDSPEELARKDQRLFLDYLIKTNDLSAIPDVVELIQDLHGKHFTLVLATSSSWDIMEMVLLKLNLTNYFHSKISGAALKHAKPHPEIFLVAARLAGADPAACLVIEDSENGIKAAKAAGMKCIGFANPHSGSQNLELAEATVYSFKEIQASWIQQF